MNWRIYLWSLVWGSVLGVVLSTAAVLLFSVTDGALALVIGMISGAVGQTVALGVLYERDWRKRQRRGPQD